MAYKGFTQDCDTLIKVVVRALNDMLTTASATTNPYAYPTLTAGDDTPTAFSTDALTASVTNRSAVEFPLGGTPRDWYKELTGENGAIVRCLRQLPYASTRTIWYTFTPMLRSNRCVLILNY